MLLVHVLTHLSQKFILFSLFNIVSGVTHSIVMLFSILLRKGNHSEEHVHVIPLILSTNPLSSVSISFPSLLYHERLYSFPQTTLFIWASCGLNSDCPLSHYVTVESSLASDGDLPIISHLNQNRDKIPQYSQGVLTGSGPQLAVYICLPVVTLFFFAILLQTHQTCSKFQAYVLVLLSSIWFPPLYIYHLFSNLYKDALFLINPKALSPPSNSLLLCFTFL